MDVVLKVPTILQRNNCSEVCYTLTYFYADPGEMLELCVYNNAGCRLCLCWWSWCPSWAARGWEYVFINSARSPRYPSCPSSPPLPLAGGHDTTHLALFWKTAHLLAPAPASPIPSLRPQRTRQMYNQWFSVQQSINHEAPAHWTDISSYLHINR